MLALIWSGFRVIEGQRKEPARCRSFGPHHSLERPEFPWGRYGPKGRRPGRRTGRGPSLFSRGRGLRRFATGTSGLGWSLLPNAATFACVTPSAPVALGKVPVPLVDHPVLGIGSSFSARNASAVDHLGEPILRNMVSSRWLPAPPERRSRMARSASAHKHRRRRGSERCRRGLVDAEAGS